MTDFATISTVLTSIKTATDIVKVLRETDASLEKAELKMRLADLVSTLADAKIQLSDVQTALQDKEKRIRELEEAFELKDQLVRRSDAYYRQGPDGKATGVPYCLRCWEVDHKCRQLVSVSGDHRRSVCPACQHKYEGYSTPTIAPSVTQSESSPASST